MSKRSFWLVAISTAVPLLAIACGSGSDDDEAASQAAAVQDGQALAEVQRALTNFATVKNFKVVLTAQTRNPAGMVVASTFTYDFVPPDKYQLYTGPTAGITRVVGSESFAYDRAADRWTLITDYSGPAYEGFNKLFDPKRMTDLASALADPARATVTKGGAETVEGKTCQLYVVRDVPTQNKTDMCIENNLPLRFVFQSGGLMTTAVFSNYNSNVEIERPRTN